MEGIPLPDPLRGSDIPSFTHYSIVTRLPEIARRTLAENRFSPAVVAKIQQLIDEIPGDSVRSVALPLSPDSDSWAGYIRPYLGQNWLQIPWFFAEEYFYLRVLEATGYFHPGEGRGQDPYAVQKRLGLETTRAEIQMLAEQLSALPPGEEAVLEGLRRLLLIDLWGNQNDLSLWPAIVSDDKSTSSEGNDREALRESLEHLLVDERNAALQTLEAAGLDTARVDFLVDNAGYELVCDLALADTLLGRGLKSQVVFHVKTQPVFVSDAMEVDVRDTLGFLGELAQPPARQMAARLEGHLSSGRFQLMPHPFWTSPLPLWDLPDDLRSEFSRADLLLSKGDANYRRLLGDRHWPLDMPFSEVVSYLPVAVLSLRTSKSEIAVGLSSNHIPQNDPDWMSNGRWGMIQFAPAKNRV